MEVQCECGVLNEIEFHYHKFGPLNQEKEDAYCVDCQKLLGRFKCYQLTVNLAKNENS